MTEATATMARTLAMLSHGASRPQGTARPARDRVLRVLVTDLVAARTAAGMTQHEVATRMWTTKSAVSRLESGRYARPTLDTIEKVRAGRRRASRDPRAPRLVGPFLPSADEGAGE